MRSCHWKSTWSWWIARAYGSGWSRSWPQRLMAASCTSTRNCGKMGFLVGKFGEGCKNKLKIWKPFADLQKPVKVVNSVCPSNSSMVLRKPRDDLPVTQHFRESFPILIPIKIVVELLKTLAFVDGFSQNHWFYDCTSTLPKCKGFWWFWGMVEKIWLVHHRGVFENPVIWVVFFGWVVPVEFFWLEKPVKLFDFFWLGDIGWIFLAGKTRETVCFFLARWHWLNFFGSRTWVKPDLYCLVPAYSETSPSARTINQHMNRFNKQIWKNRVTRHETHQAIWSNKIILKTKT